MYLAYVIHNLDIFCNLYFFLVIIGAVTDKAREWYSEQSEEVRSIIIALFVVAILGMLLIPEKEALYSYFQ